MQFFFLRTKLLYGKSTMKGSVLQIDPETKKNRRKSSLIDFVGSLRTHAILGGKKNNFSIEPEVAASNQNRTLPVSLLETFLAGLLRHEYNIKTSFGGWQNF